MTFLFRAIPSGELTYINAFDLLTAIAIFESHYFSSDQKKYQIFVRIN